tara:strand:+ start:2529 stop:3248 length:720 start_codon:yes stop_codon:yes gene_type:complete
MKGKFKTFSNYHGILAEEDNTTIYGFENLSCERAGEIIIEKTGGAFGYINKGYLKVKVDDTILSIAEGFYFSLPDNFEICEVSEKYQFALWVQKEYNPMIQVGKVEDYGRLNYIDGCHDSMLVHPIKKGNPCLNALYMPEGVNQTAHTHPSLRSGFIITGGAKCITNHTQFNLEDGQIFYLETNTVHKFRTDYADYVRMKLVAFHPDSDFGAEDENHPMINRTIVGGVSASDIDEIKTK